ncbi:MAG: integration host factor subunit alpha [Deltaproteobacteria bacterium]|nr:integration host factor subunit alpha [Deltaproteobacteria bacterium]
MTLTKLMIVQAVAESNGLTKQKASDTVETIIDLIKSRLESGEDVLISGFGKFCVNEKNKRRGRNPATGEDMMLKARKIVTFKCSGKLRENVNGGKYER